MSANSSENKVVYTKWIKKGTNTFIPTDNCEILSEIEAGVYELRVAVGIGFYMLKKELYLDELLEFPSKIYTNILSDIKDFWGRKEKFKEYGFAFKRGILLHGRAGSGKSCIINISLKYVINELNGVVIPLKSTEDLELYASAIPEIFRVIEKDRPLVIIFEDIENMCQGGSIESLLLNVLDGLDQLENVVYIACPAPETMILKNDLSWVRADSLQIGDELIAFDESGPQRKMRTSVVNSCPVVQRKRYKITTDKVTTIVSEKHPFLVQGTGWIFNWKQVEELKIGSKIGFISHPWKENLTWEGGYLAGQFDGEGHLNFTVPRKGSGGIKICWAQAEGIITKHVSNLIRNIGFKINIFRKKRTVSKNGKFLHKKQLVFSIADGKWKCMEFLGSIRPKRLLANPKLKTIWEGRRLCPDIATVLSIEYIGEGPVIALDTSTKTFIGDGLLQHNTTNYIEQLKERIINRPSRFDRRIYVPFLSYDDRVFYFKNKLKGEDLKTIDINEWATDTDGLSIAHLAELIKSVIIFGGNYQETINTLKEMNDFAKLHSSKYEKNGGSIGFNYSEDKCVKEHIPIHQNGRS